MAKTCRQADELNSKGILRKLDNNQHGETDCGSDTS